MANLKALCAIGSRRVGTSGNTAARKWITGKLTGMGYTVETDSFTSTYAGNPQGVNVVVTIEGADRTKMVVIGAHYDTIEGIEGCEDNATGTVALLEIARQLAGKQPVMDVCLVFFDSEEYGHSGSEHFASIHAARTALMINLDCVGYGDELYVYSYAGTAGGIREFAMERAGAMGIDLTTHAGSAKYPYPAGTTGPWSDHAPFESRGVNYLYFEASNIAIDIPGETRWWGYTAADPSVLHTRLDRMDYMLPKYGARMEKHVGDTAAVSVDLVLNGFD